MSKCRRFVMIYKVFVFHDCLIDSGWCLCGKQILYKS